MRTTLTLNDDLVTRLKELARRRRTSFKEVVNDVIRHGLSKVEPGGHSRPDYRVHTFRSPFRPGVDPEKLNQLADELEARRFSGSP